MIDADQAEVLNAARRILEDQTRVSVPIHGDLMDALHMGRVVEAAARAENAIFEFLNCAATWGGSEEAGKAIEEYRR